MAFGSQFALSTTKQNTPCQWNLDVRKGKDVAVGYDAQEGNPTVTKQQGSRCPVAWIKTSWLSPTKGPSPKTWPLLAISPNQLLPRGKHIPSP